MNDIVGEDLRMGEDIDSEMEEIKEIIYCPEFQYKLMMNFPSLKKKLFPLKRPRKMPNFVVMSNTNTILWLQNTTSH